MTNSENITYVIPYVDQKSDFWSGIAYKYGSKIKSVYFPIMDEEIGTGRPKQPEKELLGFLESRILPVSVLINPVVLHKPIEYFSNKILRTIESYLNKYNLVELTLSNLELAQIIRKEFPELKISASTLMEIYNLQQLEMIEDAFDTLVPSNRALRDLKTLKMLKANFKGKIRILVNESCLPSCVYRTQHFYEMSSPEIEYPHSLCNSLLQKKAWLRLTGGWILPQHLFMLNGVYDEIKLAGRISLQKRERYLSVLDGYINRTRLHVHEIGGGPASVDRPINIDPAFYAYTLSCLKNCLSCSYCEDYWNENMTENA